MIIDWQTRLPDWLDNHAVPLWTGVGIDDATGTAWEALDHSATPLEEMPRRLRVQLRQAYCFAQTGHLPLAQQLFRFALDQGFDPRTGNLAALLAPDLTITSAPHDLYDLAFSLLASAALIEAGADIEADLARLEASLARLKADRGWYENASGSMPRRQNPHMHTFEASTALFVATGEGRFRAMAQECLGLFRDAFFQPNGEVFEFFDADWTPLTGDAQAVEPGHMAEWVYLLDRYEVATGENANVDLPQLYGATLECRDSSGLLPDKAGVQNPTRRMWPQTELFKAAIAMDRQNLRPSGAPSPEDILGLMWRDYIETAPAGGWFDRRDSDGSLVSDTMPASTFYHILVAFRFYLAQTQGA